LGIVTFLEPWGLSPGVGDEQYGRKQQEN